MPALCCSCVGVPRAAPSRGAVTGVRGYGRGCRQQQNQRQEHLFFPDKGAGTVNSPAGLEPQGSRRTGRTSALDSGSPAGGGALCLGASRGVSGRGGPRQSLPGPAGNEASADRTWVSAGTWEPQPGACSDTDGSAVLTSLGTGVLLSWSPRSGRLSLLRPGQQVRS